MALQKFTVYVCASTDSWSEGELKLLPCDPTDCNGLGAVLICSREVEIDVPLFNFAAKQIDAFNAAIQKERADSQAKINLLLERISNLQAIGHEVVE